MTLPLFDLPRRDVFQKGSLTSRDAAASHDEGIAERDRRLILAELTRRGDATQAELSAALGIPRHVLCIRCAELSGRYEGWPTRIRQTVEKRGRSFVWKGAA